MTRSIQTNLGKQNWPLSLFMFSLLFSMSAAVGAQASGSKNHHNGNNYGHGNGYGYHCRPFFNDVKIDYQPNNPYVQRDAVRNARQEVHECDPLYQNSYSSGYYTPPGWYPYGTTYENGYDGGYGNGYGNGYDY